MERIRKPLQGIGNIVRFNWHFYLLAAAFIMLIQIMNHLTAPPYTIFGNIICFLTVTTILISLLVSLYVYDFSGLYELNWLNNLTIEPDSKIVNINAGFDETSSLIKNKFPGNELTVFDFYDPLKHTEISIKRARRAYPAFPGTLKVTTNHLPLPDNYSGKIFIIFSAHEIRNNNERNIFFNELKRILNNSGQIVITEHLRNLPNFLAYNIGFFHFFSKKSWYSAFEKTGLHVSKEIKITPFITTFILTKHGVSS